MTKEYKELIKLLQDYYLLKEGYFKLAIEYNYKSNSFTATLFETSSITKDRAVFDIKNKSVIYLIKNFIHDIKIANNQLDI